MGTVDIASKNDREGQRSELRGLPGWFRVVIAAVIVNGLLNAVILNLIFESRLVPLITALWMAAGYLRIFGRSFHASSFRKAFKGVIMAMVWPFVPVRR